MCFCFDGESVVAAYQPACERRPGASTPGLLREAAAFRDTSSAMAARGDGSLLGAASAHRHSRAKRSAGNSQSVAGT